MQSQTDSFQGLGIAPKLFEILTKLGFTVPTPIQLQSIPSAIEGKDIIGIAQTGTGKTLAFGIPMLQRLVQLKGSKGLIVVPTRELAIQVDESLQKVGKGLGLKTVVLIGGEDIRRQIRSLRFDPHVIIATPGRLIDHLEQKTARLDKVQVLVLDEADRMLDMGFAPQIKKVLEHVPSERQTMLFSATMPAEIAGLANKYMKLPLRVEVAQAGTTAKDVSQELFFVDKNNKVGVLETVLKQYRGSVLVFTRTKYGAKKIAKVIRDMGNTAAELHSNRSLAQRKEAMQGFKLGKYRVLVATDIAARGIDVTGIELVVNYDLPANAEDYVHRIGRTGRAGSVGHAISFAGPHERSDIKAIERMIRMVLPVSSTPEPAPRRAMEYSPRMEDSRRASSGFSRESTGSRPSSGYAGRHSSTGSSRPSYGAAKPSYGAKASYVSRANSAVKPTHNTPYKAPYKPVERHNNPPSSRSYTNIHMSDDISDSSAAPAGASRMPADRPFSNNRGKQPFKPFRAFKAKSRTQTGRRDSSHHRTTSYSK